MVAGFGLRSHKRVEMRMDGLSFVMYGFNVAVSLRRHVVLAKLSQGGADGGPMNHRGQVQRLCRNFFTRPSGNWLCPGRYCRSWRRRIRRKFIGGALGVEGCSSVPT